MIKAHNVSYSAETGKVYCKICRRHLATLHNPYMRLVLNTVCQCDTLGNISIEKIRKEAEAVALNVDDSIICRSCGKTLFKIEKSEIINFAFRAECDCGAVAQKAAPYQKQTRRLGEYAEGEDINDKTYCDVEI